MTALFHFTVREQGIKLLSDYEMTRDGEKLWRSIIARHFLNVSVVDLIGGQQYSFDEVGLSTTEDGELVIWPEKDWRPIPTNLKSINNTNNEQRFVYLAEKYERVETLLEDIDPRVDPFGINTKHPPIKLQKYVYFYEPMP